MDHPRFQMYGALVEHAIRLRDRTDSCFIPVGKIRPDDGPWILRDVCDPSLGNHLPAVRSGSLPHLDHPVGMLQNPCVMIDDDDGIPIRPQIVHHAGQPLEIMGVQADRRLIENIQHAGRPVANRPCELHPLTFTCGKR